MTGQHCWRACRMFALLIAAIVGVGTPAAAQDSASMAGDEPQTAPVVVDGVALFNVRGTPAYPAERRAGEVAGRISALAADRAVQPESLRVRETPTASSIVLGVRRIVNVFDADAELEEVERPVLAEVYRMRVVEAVHQYRRDRAPQALLDDTGRATLATLALLLALAIGGRLLRWLRGTLGRRMRLRIPDLRLRSVTLVRGEQLWPGLHSALGLLAALLALFAVFTWLHYVLVLFPWTRAAGRGLSDALLSPLAALGTGVLRFVPNLLFLTILVVLVRYVLKAVRLFFQRVGDGTLAISGFDPDWAHAVDRIVRILVVAFALVVAYPYIPGSQSEAFKGVTILLGVLFSIGSPSVFGNVVAGQSLAFRRAFKVGDRIRVGEHVGRVTQVRLMTTSLRTAKNEQVVIPNSVILNAELVNYSTFAPDPGLILHTTVGIGYEVPWRQVEAMLLEAAARTPGIQREPAPFVLQRSLGVFSVEYEINAYAGDPHSMLRLYDALHRNILDLFNEHAVQIMTPAYEGDPERPKVVPRGQWYAAPAAPAAPADLAARTDGEGATGQA